MTTKTLDKCVSTPRARHTFMWASPHKCNTRRWLDIWQAYRAVEVEGSASKVVYFKTCSAQPTAHLVRSVVRSEVRGERGQRAGRRQQVYVCMYVYSKYASQVKQEGVVRREEATGARHASASTAIVYVLYIHIYIYMYKCIHCRAWRCGYGVDRVRRRLSSSSGVSICTFVL
jgi:hypothetical protein